MKPINSRALALNVFIKLSILIIEINADLQYKKDTEIEMLSRLLYDKLGIDNNSSMRHISKRSIDSNEPHSHIHMYKLYNNYNRNKIKNTFQDFSTPYNIIRSFHGSSKCNINATRCNNGQIKTYMLNKNYFNKAKYAQVISINEVVEFDLNKIDLSKEKFSNAELNLKLELAKLIKKNDFISINKNKTDKHFNELSLKFTISNKELAQKFNKKLRASFEYKVDELIKNLIKEKTFKFNLEKLLKYYLANSFKANNGKLELDINLSIEFKSGLKKYELNSNINKLEHFSTNKPLLVIYLLDDSNSNLSFESSPLHQTSNKLSLNKQNENNNKCNKRELIIDFKELGLDKYIVEPKYLKTHYCDGSCNLPIDDNFRGENHAILQSLASRFKRYNFLPKICCTPSKVSSRLFLFLDNDNSLVLKKIDDVVVDSCSCQ